MTGGASSRRKGHNAERAVAAYLRERGYADARRTLAGDGRQPGDIDGIPGVCLEVKNAERVQLTPWLAQVEAETPRGSLGFVVVKLPRLTDPGEWALVTRLRELPGLIL